MGLRSPHEGKSLPAPSVLGESPAVLKTAGVSKRIRKEVIFEDISLSAPKGGVTAITGQNGAGKTTLAQILCGLARQTRGHILIDRKKRERHGRTILVLTHDRELIESCCDNVVEVEKRSP